MTLKHSIGDVLFATAIGIGCWVIVTGTVDLFAKVIK